MGTSKTYVTRRGELVETWRLRFRRNGFEYSIYIEGTEAEMRDYAGSELGDEFSYHAIGYHEYELVKELGVKVYLAPQI